jgi:hypothetical protein
MLEHQRCQELQVLKKRNNMCEIKSILKKAIDKNLQDVEKLSNLFDDKQLWNDQDVINWQDKLNEVSIKYNKDESNS